MPFRVAYQSAGKAWREIEAGAGALFIEKRYDARGVAWRILYLASAAKQAGIAADLTAIGGLIVVADTKTVGENP